MIDPLDMNVPEIGKKVESIPVERVMDAMQALETELKEFYASQALELEDAIQRVRDLAEERKKGGMTGGCEYCLSPSEVLEALDGADE